MKEQIETYKKKISIFIGGTVCLLICSIIAVAVFYELKIRSIVGGVYLADKSSGISAIDSMFFSNVSSKTLDAFNQGVIAGGYTKNGSLYLFYESGQFKLFLIIAVVIVCIITIALIFIKRIGRQDLYGIMERISSENDTLKLQMGQLNLYTEKRSRILYEFIENIAHQIKTPLTALTLSLDIIREKYSESHMENTINEAIINAERIKEFIVRLMNISRLESGKVIMKHNEINLSEFLNEAAALSNVKGCTLDIKCENETYLLYGDNDWLMDAFTNIIGNSSEHALKNELDGGKVEITAETLPEKCIITIKDNGKGFKDGDCLKIFDRFESEGSAKSFHMGIGLNLSKLVIEAHYGTISAYNDRENGGAVFRVVFPKYKLKTGK